MGPSGLVAGQPDLTQQLWVHSSCRVAGSWRRAVLCQLIHCLMDMDEGARGTPRSKSEAELFQPDPSWGLKRGLSSAVELARNS